MQIMQGHKRRAVQVNFLNHFFLATPILFPILFPISLQMYTYNSGRQTFLINLVVPSQYVRVSSLTENWSWELKVKLLAYYKIKSVFID